MGVDTDRAAQPGRSTVLDTGAVEDRQLKGRHRALWASGDYPRVAAELIPDLGAELVRACGVTTGQRVLDVAAGSGNAAIPAGEAGARVTASDLTPELLEAGRCAAATNLDLRRQQVVFERPESPEAFRTYWRNNYGPTRAVYAFTAPDPDRIAGLDRAFLDVLTTWNRAGADEPLRYEAEYLLVTARTRDSTGGGTATGDHRRGPAPVNGDAKG